MSQQRSGSRLFPEFPPTPTSAWMGAIEKDLKGASFEKKLVWQTGEGFAVKPFYRSEDLTGLEYLTDNLPGQFPYTRGVESLPQGWGICEEITEADVRQANELARAALSRGAGEVVFVLCPTGGGLAGPNIQSLDDLRRLLADLPLGSVKVHFRAGAAGIPLLGLVAKLFDGAEAAIRGTVDCDPLGDLALSGGTPLERERFFAQVSGIVRLAQHAGPDVRALAVRGWQFHEAGSTVVQELGYSLAVGAEYLTQLTERKMPINDAAAGIFFVYGIGGNYFFEIAKFRAARLLWARIVESFGGSPEAAKAHVQARTSRYTKTLYDPHVNLLRATTEAMAGAIGGVDSLTVGRFNETYQQGGEFASRLARNTQIILKDEAYLDRAMDAGAGSYYIEVLTDSIARAAWSLFQKVEAEGGFLQALEKGSIQEEIARSAANRDAAIAARRTPVLGTNHYPNLRERMLEQIEAPAQAAPYRVTQRHEPSEAPGAPDPSETVTVGDVMQELADLPSAITVKPLKLYRGAQVFEEIRLRTERHAAAGNRTPRVFLLEAGDLKMRKARAGFAASFFGCAGFDVIAPGARESLEKAVSAAVEREADIVVLCSSDPEYPPMARAVIEGLAAAGRVCPVIVAGSPQDTLEELKQAGVADFIHIRSNAAAVLSDWQQRLGVKG